MGSQVLQSPSSKPPTPPLSLPPLLQPHMSSSFCPNNLPQPSPAALLPPSQLPEPGEGPTAAPAPTTTGKKHEPTLSLPPPPPQQQEHKGAPVYAVWCVAKPTVPQVVMQEAMDYACGSGADCKEIQVNGPCYQPDTLLSHASFAFNNYFQNKKKSGGTCDFGGTAMLVTADPSKDLFYAS